MATQKQNEALLKVADFILGVSCVVGICFLGKFFLSNLGIIWGLETFANISWHDYWAYSGIAGLYVAGISARARFLEKKLKLHHPDDEDDQDFALTIKTLTYGFMLTFAWAISWIICNLFFI